MKICVAQTRPITGDIARNIERHKAFVATAVSHQANLIIFPELSLTGYEPTLAQALAIQPDDPRLDVFQTLADTGQIMIGVGAPTQNQSRPCISLIIFQTNRPRQLYTKHYLHEDELPFFTSGERVSGLVGDKNEVALAICYELSVPQHAAAAAGSGAAIYIASVAKFVNGMEKANKRLAEIARQHHMTVFMANCIGPADGAECAGQSAVWNCEGTLVARLDVRNEGVLIFDTVTETFIQEMI
ncbi:MAG: carbon-nitrogen hydrolase family protein [Anaerolineaceae bacterium]|nr:carbon-nitrogen hydrolase family protein [Anaerolineaceae bacterium]